MGNTLGILAGLGDLPVAIAEHAIASGRDVLVLRFAGFDEPRLAAYPGRVVGLGEVGGIMKSLKAAGCSEVVFAGIVKRPDFKSLKLDLKGAALLPKVIREARNGDDALLSVIVSEFEAQGFKVVGSEDAYSALLAPEGLIAGPMPDTAQMADIARGADVAAMSGAMDIGQGCVVCDGLVLAVEAQEGTDEMLRRCAGLPVEVRGQPGARRGVLVKRPKPGQERRIDMPTTGPSTIELAAEAGLAGIAVEAGGALMLSRKEMEQRANDLGLFIYGFAAEPAP